VNLTKQFESVKKYLEAFFLNTYDLLVYIKESADLEVTCMQIKALIDVCVALNQVAGYDAGDNDSSGGTSSRSFGFSLKCKPQTND